MSVTNTLLGFPNQGSIGGDGSYFLPPEYTLPMPKNGARIMRRWIKRDVTTAMPITSKNPIIRWNVPNDGVKILDFRRATVLFDVAFSVNAPYIVRPSALMWNIIERFRLEQAGQYVEDRRYYGFQETMNYRICTHLNQQITTGEAFYGDGDRNVRELKHLGGASWRYALPIPSTALTKCIMPWYRVGKAGMAGAIPEVWLQWELASPASFLEVVTPPGLPVNITQLDYTITRVQIQYEEVFGDGGNNVILSNWNPSPSMFPRIYYRSFLSNQYALSTALQQTIPIEFKLSSIICIYITFHISNNLTNPLINDKFEEYLGIDDLPLDNYQFDMNGCLWPDQPVNMTDRGWVEAYLMYQRAFQMYHARVIQQEVTPISLDEYRTNKFVLVLDCNEHPLSNNIINPVSTRNSTQNIQLKLSFTAPPTAGIICLAHMYHWRAWNYGATGNVPLFEQ